MQINLLTRLFGFQNHHLALIYVIKLARVKRIADLEMKKQKKYVKTKGEEKTGKVKTILDKIRQ